MWDFRDLGPDFALKAKNPPINMSGLKFIKYNRPKNRVNVDIGAGAYKSKTTTSCNPCCFRN